jgi:predicted outer membrane protein
MRSKWLLPTISLISALSIGSVLAQTHVSQAQAQARQTSASPTASPSASASPAATSYFYDLNTDLAANTIHHINELAIEEANTALLRLQTSTGQQIAQTLLTDHETSEQQLVNELNSTSTEAVLYVFQPATYEAAVDSQLSAISDADYDTTYLQVQLTAQRRALSNLQLVQSSSSQSIPQVAGQSIDMNITSQVNTAIALVQGHISLLTGALNGTYSSPTPSPSPSASASAVPTASPTVSVAHR